MCLNSQLLITRWQRWVGRWWWWFCFSSGCTHFEGDVHLTSSCRFLSSSSVTVQLCGAFHLVSPDEWKGCVWACRTSSAFAEGHIQIPLMCTLRHWFDFCVMEYVLERRDSPVGTPCAAFLASGGWGADRALVLIGLVV